MSTTNMNIALSLSDEEFELVLRQRLQRAFADVAPGTSMIMLLATTTYGKNNELKEAKWKVGTTNTTEGEILSQCITEHNRRVNFEKTCTLRIIEATPTITPEPKQEQQIVGISVDGYGPTTYHTAPTTTLGDEIPF